MKFDLLAADALDIDEAADALGVPAVQLLRWVRDGAVEDFLGSRLAAEQVRFRPSDLQAIAEWMIPNAAS